MRNRRKERGGSVLEFALVGLTLGPLIFGTATMGLNMVKVQETTQLSREAGEMFARGLDMSQPGNQTILANIGAPLGLSTDGTGSAEIILSAITYVDVQTCAAAGAVDANGNPSGCTNYQKWVFAQRLIIGNASIRNSNLGSPLTSGPTGVTIDPTTGEIPVSDYATKSGAVATFSSINPYANVGGKISGLPTGQYIYIAEGAANTFAMSPYGGSSTYSFGMF